MGEDNGEGSADSKDTTAFNVTYAMDAVTIGWSTYENDTNATKNSTAGATRVGDDTLTAIGISYAVTDSFSVSYGEHELDLGSSTSDQESEGFSASYTMGGMSIVAQSVSMDNVGGSTDSRDDIDG